MPGTRTPFIAFALALALGLSATPLRGQQHPDSPPRVPGDGDLFELEMRMGSVESPNPPSLANAPGLQPRTRRIMKVRFRVDSQGRVRSSRGVDEIELSRSDCESVRGIGAFRVEGEPTGEKIVLRIVNEGKLEILDGEAESPSLENSGEIARGFVCGALLPLAAFDWVQQSAGAVAHAKLEIPWPIPETTPTIAEEEVQTEKMGLGWRVTRVQ